MDWGNEIREFFKKGDMLMQLIVINVAVFILYHIIHIFFLFFNATGYFDLDNWLAAPSDLHVLLTRPWTLVTYMFFHIEILHLLFNMLWLYWFGRIFRMYFSGRQLVNTYLLGGLMGVLVFISVYNIFPGFTVGPPLLGASAGVLAVVMAISCYVPRYTLHLLFFGPVKLIYIAAITVVLDIVSISMSDNAGGHIAHLGGAFFGYLFAANIHKGKDITAWLSRFFGWCGRLFKPKPRMKVEYKKPPTNDWEYNRQVKDNQSEIDRILDKIAKGGYDSLSKKEKETLFKQKQK